MKVTIVSKEFPPHIYGGAGVHVRFLVRELARSIDVDVRSFGDQNIQEENLAVRGHSAWQRMFEGDEIRFNPVLGAFSVVLSIIRDKIDADIIHTHTWYAALAGYLGKTLYNIPHVLTVHSLEPLRPWKEEQLGASYHLSTWAERIALENAEHVIAVSKNSREDIIAHFNVDPERISVIHNGIDPDLYRPLPNEDATRKAFNINRDYILFVGRTSRQKGMTHLIDAMKWIKEGVQCVFCTSAPDTKELEDEISARIAGHRNIIWINSLLREEQYVELYSNARVFVCPSIYEPFGIINLEAMSCETPVVASAVGGILETVVDGKTGILVEPGNPEAIAEAVNKLLDNPSLSRELGRNGRKRVKELFSWSSIAKKTITTYESIIREYREKGRQSG